MNKIIIIRPDGTTTTKDDMPPPSLKELQEWVEGYIELLTWPTNNIRLDGEPIQAYVNEEGLFDDLPINSQASDILVVDGWNMDDPLCGTVVILTGSAKCE